MVEYRKLHNLQSQADPVFSDYLKAVLVDQETLDKMHEDPIAYGDSVGIATIGIGYNLTKNLGDVLVGMGLDPTAADKTTGRPLLTAQQVGVEKGYISQISAIVNEAWVPHKSIQPGSPNDPNLSKIKSLNAIMKAFASDPLLKDVPGRQSTFTLSEQGSDTVYDILLKRYKGELSKPAYHRHQLFRGDLKGFNPSKEYAAILDLYWNSPSIVGNGLVTDITNNSRAEAWWEIRYNSNGGKSESQGIANRRYFVSYMLSLMGTGNQTEVESALASVEAYQMYTLHQTLAPASKSIEAYESKWTPKPKKVYTNFQGYKPHDIEEEMNPAYRQVLHRYDVGQFISLPWKNVEATGNGLHPAALRAIAPGNYLQICQAGQSISAFSGRNNILVARGRGATLTGGNQVNVLASDVDQNPGAITFNCGQNNLIYAQGSGNTYNIGGKITVVYDGAGGNRFNYSGGVVVELAEPGGMSLANVERLVLSKFRFGASSCANNPILLILNPHSNDTFVGANLKGVGLNQPYLVSANGNPGRIGNLDEVVYTGDKGYSGDESFLNWRNQQGVGSRTNTVSASMESSVTLNASLNSAQTTPGVTFGDVEGQSFASIAPGASIFGLGNGDEFLIGRGLGSIDISDVQSVNQRANIVRFAADITPGMLQVSGDANGNLVIDLGSGDNITLDNALTGTPDTAYGIQLVAFSDGSTLTYADLLRMADTGNTDNTSLFGDDNANVIDSKGYATYAQGNGGADTFVYNVGYGALEINEADTAEIPGNVLAFGAGIDPAAIGVTGNANGDLILTISSTDRITLDNALNSANGTSYGVQRVTFADGTVWTYADLLSRAEAPSASASGIYGDNSANTLDIAGQVHFVQGGGGGDTFVYNSGYGALTISEADTAATPDNVLRMGAGIAPSSLGVSADASGDILLNLGNGDLITLQNALNSAGGTTYGVQQISFADGTVWSYTDLVARAETGSATNIRLFGGAGAETFDSKGSATYEQGGGGGDTFVYNSGYGALTINEQDQESNPDNVLAFGAGITASDVHISATAQGDLVLDIGNGDRVTLTAVLLSGQYVNGGFVDNPGVQTVSFVDGTRWSLSDLLAKADIGSADNKTLFGDASANVFDSTGYATFEQGEGGGDTFLYNSGYGALTINEIDAANAVDNVLTFGTGIIAADVSVSTDINGDILLSLGGSDVITLKGMAASAHAGVQAVHFADGTVWNAAQIVASTDNGTLVIDPSAAAAAVGSTYYATGANGIRDIDASATAPQAVETVAINGSSYSYSVSAVDGSNDILITDYSGEGVRLVGALANGGANVPSISFADGTTWTYAQLAEKLQTPGSSSAPGLFGDSHANILDTQGQANFAQGGGGGDTFVYQSGYGSLEINETDAALSPANTLSLGSGIDPSSVAVSADANGNIILTLSSGDQITLDNALNNSPRTTYGVQQISFANGTNWSYADLLQKLETPVAGAAGIYGDDHANTLDPRGLVGFVQGGGGNDTFVYNAGYGALEISEIDSSANPANILAFGSGILPSQVSVHADEDGNIVLSLGGDDQITLDGALSSVEGATSGVQRVTFTDGTSWTAAQLASFANAVSTDTSTLVGTDGADRLDPGGTASYVQGNGGGDTFVYDRGYSAVEINEADTAANPGNLYLGADIDPSQVAVSSDGQSNIVLDFGGGDRITLDNALNSTSGTTWGVQRISFADGTTWSYADVLGRLETATGARVLDIAATPGSVLDGKGTASYSFGKGGGDTFIYNEGYGQLTISEADLSASPHNALAFGNGIAPSDISVSADLAGNIILSTDQDNEVILQNALNSGGGTSYGVQTVTFADGTNWSYADLLRQVKTASIDSAGIFGDRHADVLDTKGLTGYAQGNGGGDTFIYNSGYGTLEISEADRSASPANVLAFGTGIAPADVTVTSDANGDIVLTLSSTDKVIIDNALNSGGGTSWGVQQITFANGTSWSMTDLLSALATASSPTAIIGTPDADTLHASGTTYLAGGGGGDTFTYANGDGYVTINEADVGATPANTLAFGTGIIASQVDVSADSSGDLILSLSDTDVVVLQNALNSATGTTYGVQTVAFADGTSWSYADLLSKVESPSTATDGIYGDAGANALDTQGLASYVRGGGGGDTFAYDRGYGALEIDESDSAASPDNTLSFGAGVLPSDMVVTSDSAGDILLSLGGADEITLKDALNSGDGTTYGVQHVTFQDGTNWSIADLIAKATIQASGDIYGDASANTLDTHGLASFAQGGGGGDTFVYNLRYGALEIDEEDTSPVPDNVLAFGAGISVSSLTVSGDASGDLVLSLGGSDQITLDKALQSGDGTAYGVQSVTFQDGTSLSYAQLVDDAATGSAANSSIYGDGGANIVDSKGLASYAAGNGGGDTFVYDRGYGALEIDEQDSAANPSNVLAFGAGIDPTQVAVTADADGRLILDLGGSDQITIDNALNSADGANYGVQRVTFADGTSWSYADLLTKSEVPSSGATGIYGDGNANVLDTRGSTHLAKGGGGGDTFVYNTGYGALELDEQDSSANPANVLALGAGIDPSQVAVTADADGNLILNLGGSDQITITKALNSGDGTTYGVQTVRFAGGTSWTYADLLAKADMPSAGNKVLYGDGAANILDSQGLATFEQGNGGEDTFVYDRGYGALTINEVDAAGARNVLAFGATINPSDVTASLDGSGNILLDLGQGDLVTLQGAAPGGDAAGALSVTFANGQVWTAAQLAGLAAGSVDFTPGSGTLVVDLAANPAGNIPAVVIGAGLLMSDFSVHAGGSDNTDLILSANNGDQVILKNALSSATASAEVIRFSDGTNWTYAQLLSDVETGVAGSAGIYGDATANTLDSRGLVPYAQGGGGGDTFIYNSGYGALEINEADTGPNPANTLAFGAGIDPSQVSVTGDGNGDLILSLNGNQVTLDKALQSGGGTSYGVQQVTFADGTVWSYADLVARASDDSASNGTAIGDAGANALDTHGLQTNTFNDSIYQYVGYVQGGGGGDTIAYQQGYGAVEVDEKDTSANPNNTLTLGSGINASNVSVTGDAQGDILLNLNDGRYSDQIILDNGLNSTGQTTYGVQSVSFADGTTWSAADLNQKADTGGWRNPTLYGGTGADNFDPAGSGYIEANGGDDSIFYDTNYGALQVNEVDTSSNPMNVLKFGPDIDPSQISVWWTASGDIGLGVKEGGYYYSDQIILRNELNSSSGISYGVQKVQFADGTVWTLADLLVQANAGSGSLIGDGTANILDTQGHTDYNRGHAYAQGGGGGDTFVFNAGYGVLEINEIDSATMPANVLQFGAGIDPAQVAISGDSAGNLILDVGNGDQVIIDKALANSGGKTYGVQSVIFADGSVWTYQDMLSRAETPVAGGSSIAGDGGANLLDTQGIVGAATGNGGGDTFVYNPGYGDLVINESDNSGNPHNLLSFGAGISSTDVTVSADGSGNILLAVSGSGAVTISAGVAAESGGLTNGIQQVVFSDGTRWSYADLMRMADVGSASNATLYGDDRPELFDSKGYATAEYGRSGNDEFIYNVGYGNLAINETGGSGTSNSLLSFGTGIGLADISVSANAAGDMTLSVAGQGQITVAGEFASGGEGVGLVTFAGGGSLSKGDLQRLAEIGSPTNTSLYGTSSADNFDSAGYATYIHGGGGADTFLYKSGYGALEIDEDAGFYTQTKAQLKFGADIVKADVEAHLTANGNLVISDGLVGDQITVDNFGKNDITSTYSDRYGIGSIAFSDGNSLSQAQILQLALAPTANNGVIYGTNGNDVLPGGPDAHFEDGLGGTDTYMYHSGDGALEIGNDNGNSYSDDILRFGSDISEEDLRVRADANGNIIIDDGISGDGITIDGMLEIGRYGYTEGLNEIDFADGSSLTAKQVVAAAMIGSSTNTTVYGSPQADLIDGKGFASVEYGGGGSDTFVYNPGYGRVEINDHGYYGTSATVEVGGALTASDFTASFDSSGDVTLTDGIAGDQIVIDGEVSYTSQYGYGFNPEGVSAITFADGTSITQADLMQQAVTGSPTNTSLYGVNKAETFDPRGYAGYAQGISGQDNFIYQGGYGAFEINEDAGSGTTSNSVLAFGGDIVPADLTVGETAGGAITITDGTANDLITIDNEVYRNSDPGSQFGVNQVTFSDGESLTADQLIALATTGSGGNPQRAEAAGVRMVDTSGSGITAPTAGTGLVPAAVSMVPPVQSTMGFEDTHAVASSAAQLVQAVATFGVASGPQLQVKNDFAIVPVETLLANSQLAHA